MVIEHSTLVDVVQTCACFNLRLTSRAVTRLFDEALEACGLRSTGFALLVAVQKEISPTLPHLSRILGVDRSTLTRNLRPLVRSGLVKTGTRPGSRTARARLTPKGEKTLEQCLPTWQKAQTEVERRVGKEQWNKLLPALCRLASMDLA